MQPITSRKCQLTSALSALALVACAHEAPVPEPETAATPISEFADTEKVLIDVELTEGTNLAAALSPDGSTIIIALQGVLWSLPSTGGKATALTPPEMDAHEPVWSPDGSTIAFYAFAHDGFTLWKMNPDGSDPEQLTDGAADARYPNFTPDGGSLLYATDIDEGYQVWELDLETGATEMLTSADETGYKVPLAPYFSGIGNAVYPAISPDGSLLAFVVDGPKDALVVRETTAHGSYKMLHLADTLGAPSWVDDTSLVIAGVDAGAGHLAEAFVDSSPTRILIKGPDVFPFRPNVLADGSIIYTADGKIKTISLDRTAGEEIPFSATVTLDRTPYDRRTYDLADDTSRTALGIVDPSLSPDGSKLAYAALNDLWLADLTAGTLTQLTDDASIDLSPSWSPDGSKIVWVSDRSGETSLWSMEVATGEAVELCECSSIPNNPVWSPDGTKIAFLSDSIISIFLAGTVNVLDVATGEETVISDPVFGPSPPAWSPDGTMVAIYHRMPQSSRFREGYNALYLMPASGEGEKIWVSPIENKSLGRRQFNRPAWSADGDMVFRMDGALWSAPLTPSGEMGDMTLLTKAGENPAWSADGSALVYIDGEDLVVWDKATGGFSEIDLKPSWSAITPDTALTIRAGKVFDGTDTYLENVDILVENGVISSITPASDILPDGEFMDASDKTVLPGLIESHTHQSTSQGVTLGSNWFSFGITSVRETGDDPYRMTERKEASASGRRASPRVFAAGPLNEGARVSYGVSETVGTIEEAEDAMRRHEELGLDFFKSYVRQDYTVQKRIIELAHDAGVPVTSHELYPAVANNIDQLEHFGATSRRGYSLLRSNTGYSYQDVISLISESGMVVTPTLALMSQNGTVDIPGPVNTLKALYAAGAHIVAGTDSPFVPHGVALQAELKIYTDAGLPPAAVINTATIDAATAIGVGDQIGKIAPGYLADLIIVDGDPLVDIKSIRNVESVYLTGVHVYEKPTETAQDEE